MTRTADLRDRGEMTVLVKKKDADISIEDEQEYTSVVDMDPLIETYRDVYAEDLEKRLQIDNDKLPPGLGVATLLNPMFGLKPKVIGSELMSDEQYNNSRADLVCQMQDILDEKAPAVYSSNSDSDEIDSDDEVLPLQQNINYKIAEDEMIAFEKYKKKKYHPTYIESKSKVLTGEEKQIWVGPPNEAGKDLPSTKNLCNYIVKKTGRFDLLKFFFDHKHLFPTLWIVVQCNASRRVVEVGCERFFGLSGYISSPRRTRLGVRNYERLAMLASILQNVYIDPALVANEYLRRCKAGMWKKENTEEALKCWNLERVLEAKSLGQSLPAELTMDDLVMEEHDSSQGVILEDED
jgi:hypothetical protein